LSAAGATESAINLFPFCDESNPTPCPDQRRGHPDGRD
jgi:hypothetical protein